MPTAIRPRSTIPIVAAGRADIFLHRFLQCEHLLVSHVAAEHARERAVIPWMGRRRGRRATVTGDRRVRVRRMLRRSCSAPNVMIALGFDFLQEADDSLAGRACISAMTAANCLRAAGGRCLRGPPKRALIACSASAAIFVRSCGSAKRFSISGRPPSCAHAGMMQGAERRLAGEVGIDVRRRVMSARRRTPHVRQLRRRRPLFTPLQLSCGSRLRRAPPLPRSGSSRPCRRGS